MQKTFLAAVLLGATSMALVGCPTAPTTEQGRDELHDAVQKALADLNRMDPDFQTFLTKAHSYVIFPSVGEGGLILGGGRGRGEVYRDGKMIGNAQVTFATVGAQIGGQEYTEVIVFEDAAALDKFVNGQFAFSAKVSAVALKEGVSKAARYTDGVAVFTHAKGGLMAQAAVGGQKFSFKPLKY